MAGLNGARNKVHRGQELLSELDEQVRRWGLGVKYTLDEQSEARTGDLVVRIRNISNDAIPTRFALIAGDAVHNIRAALDHLVYELASEAGEEGTWSEFPIYEDLRIYDRNEGRHLRGLAPDVRRRIREVQPYHLGAKLRVAASHRLAMNALLAMVRRLDNADKHRIVVGARGHMPARPPELLAIRSAEVVARLTWVPLVEGSELFRIRKIEPLVPGGRLAMRHRPIFTVTFADSSATPGTPGVEVAVDDIRLAARRVLEFIEGFVLPASAVNARDLYGVVLPEVPATTVANKWASVDVHVDAALASRPVLDVFPEIIEAIEGAGDISTLWKAIETAGSSARFSPKSLARTQPGPPERISLRIVATK